MYSSGRVGGRSRERERGNSERVKKKKKKNPPANTQQKLGPDVGMKSSCRRGFGRAKVRGRDDGDQTKVKE